MVGKFSPAGLDSANDDLGCAYVLEEGEGGNTCGAPRRPSSPYCMHHHSVCYLANGSSAETRRLREVEALASAVGGRRARRSARPSRYFLARLEHTVRGLS